MYFGSNGLWCELLLFNTLWLLMAMSWVLLFPIGVSVELIRFLPICSSYAWKGWVSCSGEWNFMGSCMVFRFVVVAQSFPISPLLTIVLKSNTVYFQLNLSVFFFKFTSFSNHFKLTIFRDLSDIRRSLMIISIYIECIVLF